MTRTARLVDPVKYAEAIARQIESEVGADSEHEALVDYVRRVWVDKAGQLPDTAILLAETFITALRRCSPRATLYLTWMIDGSPHNQLLYDACRTASVLLIERGARLPTALSAWTSDVLAGKRRRPSVGAGKTRGRDEMLRMAVSDLRTRGLQPTRNEMSPGEDESACEIVSEAFGVSVSVVERAWSKRQPWRRGSSTSG